jgi:hypothetical protein
MRPLLILALVASLAAPAAAQMAGDVEWFYRNHTSRRGYILACRNDARMDQRLCRNAERAEQRLWEERNARGLRQPESPITRDAISIACQQPPSQRGLLGAYCPRGRRT